MKGTGLFNFIKSNEYGKIKIDENGFVSEITFNKNNKCIFYAKNKNLEKK
jgi:plasmid maintenance system killer protein